MVRCRAIFVVILIALWMATPALACLPTLQMSPAEMECCKKMAGNCHMGVVQHPCCNTVTNAPQPVASLQPISQIIPVAITVKIVVVPVPSTIEVETIQVGLGLPPPAPPGLHSILRI